MTEVLKAGVLSDEIDLGALAHNAAEQAEEFVRKVGFRFNQNKKNQFNCPLIHPINFRYGKPHGMCVTIVTYQNGYKTIISYIVTTGHRYHRSVHASNQFFEFTQKPVTFGHIC